MGHEQKSAKTFDSYLRESRFFQGTPQGRILKENHESELESRSK